MAKYDVDRFETPPDEDLICCICQCVLDNPLESPCRHVFCKVCIETWLTNRSNCPNCRKRLRVSKLKPVLPIVRNMINRLLIVCENRPQGCLDGIKLEMYDKHAQNCDYAPIRCLNTGCGETALRKNMLGHEQNCKYRLVMCKKGCGLPIPMEQSKKHNCLDELKKNMAAMEDQYQQRLRDLETKLNTKIQALEDRIKAMEENCQQDNSWGSARDSYSSLEGFESDSHFRAVDEVIDYVTNHLENDNDDSNSFYYSGNDDEAFASTPEYQEAQSGDGAYDFYSHTDPSSERIQQEQEQEDEGDVAEEAHGEGGGEDGRESDSAFFLNTDAESNNESDGDLNDSLLDSSDRESDVDERGGGEPVQVYVVSPTSPSSEHSGRGHQRAPEGSHSEDPSYDEVIHITSENSPHSSTHGRIGSRDRHRSSQQAQRPQPSSRPERKSRGSRLDSATSGRISPHGNASLCSLNVEYGSSGRSSPHGPESVYLSDQEGDVTEEGRNAGGSANSERSGRWQRDYSGQSVEAQEPERRSHSGSGEGAHSKKNRHHDGSSSRGHHKVSRGSKSRTERHSEKRDTSSDDRNRRSQDSRSANEQVASSTTEGREPRERENSAEDTQERRKEREYLYGIPVDDDSDSSVDPAWERPSREGSTDITISEEFSSSCESLYGDSSPDAYERFLCSLGSVGSSESDRTWTPGDPDDDGWETERDFDEDSDHHPVDHSSDDSSEGSHGAGSDSPEAIEEADSHRESSQASQRSSQRSRSSQRNPGRRNAPEERMQSRTTNEPNSESDSTARSLEGSRRTFGKKRSHVETSSESETEEDHRDHPAWKRRRHEDSDRK